MVALHSTQRFAKRFARMVAVTETPDARQIRLWKLVANLLPTSPRKGDMRATCLPPLPTYSDVVDLSASRSLPRELPTYFPLKPYHRARRGK